MNIDQATVDAVNAWQTARVVPYQDMKDGRLVALDLDAALAPFTEGGE